jgi:hypothetical protein
MTLGHANIIYMLWEPERRGLRFGKPIRLVLKERALQGLRREVDVNFQENRTFPGRTAQGRHKASRASPLGRARATCFEWSALVSADHAAAGRKLLLTKLVASQQDTINLALTDNHLRHLDQVIICKR